MGIHTEIAAEMTAKDLEKILRKALILMPVSKRQTVLDFCAQFIYPLYLANCSAAFIAPTDDLSRIFEIKKII